MHIEFCSKLEVSSSVDTAILSKLVKRFLPIHGLYWHRNFTRYKAIIFH